MERYWAPAVSTRSADTTRDNHGHRSDTNGRRQRQVIVEQGVVGLGGRGLLVAGLLPA